MAEVVGRSRDVPVVVDFWAEWCGPCRQLGPALEAAVTARDGRIDLARVDVDANQALAASFDVRGIPAVKAFRDGRVAAEFTGAIPPAQIEAFLDELAPSPAGELLDAGDEESLRRALELDPSHAGAATALARLLLASGENEAARELVEPLAGDFIAQGLAARARLAEADEAGGLQPAFEAWDSDDPETALEILQEAIAEEPDAGRRDLLRQVMVAIFTDLGADHELARVHRRRLAAALS